MRSAHSSQSGIEELAAASAPTPTAPQEALGGDEETPKFARTLFRFKAAGVFLYTITIAAFAIKFPNLIWILVWVGATFLVTMLTRVKVGFKAGEIGFDGSVHRIIEGPRWLIHSPHRVIVQLSMEPFEDDFLYSDKLGTVNRYFHLVVTWWYSEDLKPVLEEVAQVGVPAMMGLQRDGLRARVEDEGAGFWAFLKRYTVEVIREPKDAKDALEGLIDRSEYLIVTCRLEELDYQRYLKLVDSKR